VIDFSPAARDRELCTRRGGFAYFCRQLWGRGIIPGMPAGAQWTWVQQEIANHYEALWRNELPRNILHVNIPPGGGKSTIISVLGPAWIWATQNPKALLMCASYSHELQTRWVGHQFAVMRSRWFLERFGDHLQGVHPTREFYTTRGGYRYSTSVRGGGTGRHCDLYTIDDPLKAQTAANNADKSSDEARELEIVLDFMRSAVFSRGKDENSRTVVNQQRLHENDPSGFLQAAIPGTTVLRLPYWYEPESRCVTVVGGDRRSAADETLTARLSAKAQNEIDTNGGRASPVVQAQYQQRPSPPGGRVFHESTFKAFDPRARDWRPEDTILTLSLDAAFKAGADNDYVGIELWGYAAGKHLCFHSETSRLTFTQTLAHLITLVDVWRPVNILVEDKANGTAIVDVLTQVAQENMGARVVAVAPKDGKSNRARAAAAYFAAGRVYFDESAAWWPRKRDNMLRFPLGHDDDTDAMTQCLLWHEAEYGGARGMDQALGSDWDAERKRLSDMTTPQEVFRLLYGGG
jgi:predicted phage terminase large subunit-like protein